MALDSNDFELIKSLRRAVRETGDATAEKMERLIATQQKLLAASEKALGNDEKLVDAFNRMAGAIEGLAREVRDLRADLAPQMDKPRRIPKPEGRP